MKFEEKIIVALDMQYKDEVDHFLKKMQGELRFVKVGMELFYTFGPSIITKLKDMNIKVFIDLKIHDIPNTAFHAIKTLTRHEVDILNVHALGGEKMLTHARKGMEEALFENPNLKRPKLIAVTHLTSMENSDLQQLGIKADLNESILNLAKITQNASLDGVVCSPQEVKMIKENLGKNFLTVTPGIRLKSDDSSDQKRITTPKEAFQNGSDYIVMGRSLTKEEAPLKKFNQIIEELYAK